LTNSFCYYVPVYYAVSKRPVLFDLPLTRTRTSRDKYELDTPGPCVHVRASRLLAILHMVCIATLLRWPAMGLAHEQYSSIEQHIHTPHLVMCLQATSISQVRPDSIICYHRWTGFCVTLVGSTVHSSMIDDRLGQWLHAVCRLGGTMRPSLPVGDEALDRH
jgi:hypothetical protein